MELIFKLQITLRSKSSYSSEAKFLEQKKERFLAVFAPISTAFGGNVSATVFPDKDAVAQEVNGKNHAVLALTSTHPEGGLAEAIHLHAIFENLAHLLNTADGYWCEFHFQAK